MKTRKVTKMTLDEMAKTMPVLTEQEMRECIGCSGYSYQWSGSMYTISEAESMANNGTWQGGFVEGWGYIPSNNSPDSGSGSTGGDSGYTAGDKIGMCSSALGISQDIKNMLIQWGAQGNLSGGANVYLRISKGTAGVAGNIGTAIDLYNSISEGDARESFKNAAKLVANVALIAFRVNPIVGIGLSIIDMTGADDWFFEQIGF